MNTTDKPRDTSKAVSDMEERRRWCPKLQCWLYPTWSHDGRRLWVTIPE
jgi:hypothetical protein